MDRRRRGPPPESPSELQKLMFRLGSKYGTDKVLVHRYHEAYGQFLLPYIQQGGSLLEIGIHQSASLKMWLAMFPRMYIYGIDIDVSKEGERFTIHKADQSSEEQLRGVVGAVKHPVNIIVDDGSHLPEHQIISFNVLFPLLEQG